ncbi:MAG: type II toxin-antitoxin system HicA family toxin [Ignavibacteriales bacterium]|nr:type II toxin-antitoxin system HicA family toxin [Ignavibacteriales bacterium]
MSKLPQISGREVVAALLKIGYEKDRQKGSHLILRQNTYPNRRIVVPNHKEIAKGTLRSIIKQVCLTIQEFKELL